MTVTSGNTYADTRWMQSSQKNGGAISIGTGPITFIQVSQGFYTAGNGLALTGNSLGISAPVSVANGGTGLTSYGANSVIISNTAGTALTYVANPGANSILTCLTGSAPSYNSSFYTLLNTATSSSTVNTLVKRDANNNCAVNQMIESYTTTSAPLTLTASSSSVYNITSAITAQVTLPDATTLLLSTSFTLINSTTVPINILNNGATQIGTIFPSTIAQIFCTSIATSNGTWDIKSCVVNNNVSGTDIDYLYIITTSSQFVIPAYAINTVITGTVSTPTFVQLPDAATLTAG